MILFPGPRAAMLLHRAADAALMGWPAIAAIPPALAETVSGYVALARSFRPQGAHYLENHRGHLMFVKPEERPFVTADLIRLTTLTATEQEVPAKAGTHISNSERRIGGSRPSPGRQMGIEKTRPTPTLPRRRGGFMPGRAAAYVS